MSFQEINVREFSMKPFKMIGDQWMLVTAGDQIKYNTMTASWGGIGVMWGKNVAVTVIRPQRYTKEFVESHDCFTLSFYTEEYKMCIRDRVTPDLESMMIPVSSIKPFATAGARASGAPVV